MLTISVIASIILNCNLSDEIQWSDLPKPLNPGLPQTLPFKYYTPLIYNFGEVGEEEEEIADPEAKKEEAHWTEFEFGDTKIGYPKGRKQVDIDYAAGTAWGLFYWGKDLQQHEWREHAEHYINLAILTPENEPFSSWLFDTEGKKFVKTDSKTTLSVPYWFAQWLEQWPDSEQGFEIAERVYSCLGNAKAILAGTSSPLEKDRALRFVIAVAGSKKIETETVNQAKAILAEVNIPSSGSTVAMLELALLNGNKAGAQDLARRLADSQVLERKASRNLFGRIGSDVSESADAGLLLMRAGAFLDNKELFERGVQAIRWGLNTLNEPTLTANGIKVPESVSLGKAVDPSNWEKTHPLSFEWSEGALLLGFARSQNQFGGFYQDSAGWKVGIDGCQVGDAGQPVSILSSNPRPYGGEHSVIFVQETGARRVIPVTVLPSIARLTSESVGSEKQLIAIPGFLPVTSSSGIPKGAFTLQGSKWSFVAKVGTKGLVAPWPKGLKDGYFTFTGVLSGRKVTFGPVYLKRP